MWVEYYHIYAVDTLVKVNRARDFINYTSEHDVYQGYVLHIVQCALIPPCKSFAIVVWKNRTQSHNSDVVKTFERCVLVLLHTCWSKSNSEKWQMAVQQVW